MLTHSQIWQGIDSLASRHGLTPSGLAKLAGLDPTVFNKCKRGADENRRRWPSTESLAKILAATGTSLDDFVHLLPGSGKTPAATRLVPLLGWAEASLAGRFDAAGLPAGRSWERIALPDLCGAHCYALEIAGDSMLPIYRDGDRLLVSPSTTLRRGDRVIARKLAGEMMVGQLARLSARRVELESFNPQSETISLPLGELAFVHRIVWASQ